MLQMAGKCFIYLFISLDVVLREAQPLVLLPQRQSPCTGLRFTLSETLAVYTLRHHAFICTTCLWEGKCCYSVKKIN